MDYMGIDISLTILLSSNGIPVPTYDELNELFDDYIGDCYDDVKVAADFEREASYVYRCLRDAKSMVAAAAAAVLALPPSSLPKLL